MTRKPSEQPWVCIISVFDVIRLAGERRLVDFKIGGKEATAFDLANVPNHKFAH